MRREIPIIEIINQLQTLPQSTKIIVDTKADVKIIGVVVQRKEGSKQIAEFMAQKQQNVSAASTLPQNQS